MLLFFLKGKIDFEDILNVFKNMSVNCLNNLLYNYRSEKDERFKGDKTYNLILNENFKELAYELVWRFLQIENSEKNE